jgi:PAS domain S-box-containing protein
MKTILIVDDIKVNLKVLEVLLTRNGYAVLSADSARKALGLLQEHLCDLIISDIHMPEMDGFQFCRLCKLDDTLRHIPFIFYSSSHTGTRTRQQAKKVGAHAVVKKPADPARLLKTIDTILSEAPFQFLTWHPDGRTASDRPCKGRSVNVPVRGRDLTGKKRPDSRLLENIPAVVWTLDARGRFAYISPAVEKLTGFSTIQVQKMGKSGWLNRIHPADAEPVRTAFKQLFKNRAALDIAYRFECRNGKFVWLQEKSGIPYEDDTSGQYHVDGIATDISARMLDQERRLRSREQEVVNTFSKGVSHDMENLLTGMADYIQLSAMSATGPQERHRFLANALKISRSALALTREISFLSKNEKPVEKNSLFTRVVARVVRSLLEGSQIHYRVEMPRGLWPCRVDTRLMAQALEHVIINACESLAQNSDGSIEVILQNISIENEPDQNENKPDQTPSDPEIHLTREINLGPGRYIKATIQDNGCGIDGKALHQIFHPYFSLKPRDMKKGVGLGLALSRVIIARHGGEMAVRSRKDLGTKIKIFLPAENEN